MISKKYIAILFIVFIATLGIFISSCDISDPTEGLEVRLKTISRETTVNMFLKDAVDNSVIRQNATVTFEGSNAGLIIDVNNRAQTTFSTSSGFITFSVKDGTSFDAENPFTVSVRLQSSGYNETVKSVSISSGGISSTTLFMVSDEKVQSITTTGTSNEGSTGSDGSTEGDITATTTTGVSVEIPSGTVLTTDSGAPLVGQLTTSVQTVPLATNNIAASALSDGTTGIKPVMQITIEISDASGNTTTNISNAIVVYVPLDASEINPTTGEPFAIGDPVAAFADVVESGSAVKIGEGEIVSKDNGIAMKLTITPETILRKVSKVNWGWSGGVVAGAVVVENNNDDFNDPCKVVLKSTQEQVSSYSFEVFVDGRSQGSYSGSQFLSGGVGFYDILAPANVQVKYQGITVVSTSVDCGNNELTFNLSAIPTTFTINFAANGVCTDKDPAVIGQLSDAAYTYYPVNNPNDINTGVVKDGSGSVTFSPGSYTIEITYDGDTYSGNITVSSGGSVTQEGFDTSNLYYGDININGTRTTLNASNNPNIQGTNVTVYVSIDCN